MSLKTTFKNDKEDENEVQRKAEIEKQLQEKQTFGRWCITQNKKEIDRPRCLGEHWDKQY